MKFLKSTVFFSKLATFIALICLNFCVAFHPLAVLGSGGILNEACDPKIETSCQAGLTCGSISKICELPAKQNSTSQNIPQTQDSSAQVVNMASDPNTSPGNLVCKNGICLPPNEICTGGFCDAKTLPGFLILLIHLLVSLSGIIAVLFVIIGGYQYITSAGNEEQAEKGKKTLINAIIGVVVIVMSYVIINVITNLVSSPSGNGY